jgi:plastocyanin
VPRRRPRFLPALCLPICSFALLAGCGGSSAGAPAPTSTIPAGTGTHVTIIATKSGHPDALYDPDPIRIRVGQTITWTNTDSDPHDVSADNGSFYSGPIGTDGSWKWTARHPGTYTYTCTLHPDMHGTIIVAAA